MFSKFLRNIHFIAFFTITSVILWGCGQRGAPSGGPRDITPPEVVQSYPKKMGTNFKGSEIFWKFDEYVTNTGLAQELLISPPVNHPPSIKLIGKKLTLKFDTVLNENTTYSIYLGKGIKDLNEGNPLENNLFIFSTGDQIDSLSFHGEIYDGETMQPMNEGMIHLYKEVDDSVPAQQIPSYFAKINEGHFHFSNLSEGEYKLIALVDNNGNYLYDLPNEKIAFVAEPIRVTEYQDSLEIVLKSFITPDQRQFISSKKCDFNGVIQLEFNQPVQKCNIEMMDHSFKKDWKIEQWNNTRNLLTIWSTEILEQDSIHLLVSFDEELDTIFFDLSKRKKIRDQPLTVEHNFEGLGNSYKKKLALTFSQPISSYDVSKFQLQNPYDTTNIQISQENELLIVDEIFQESTHYTLQLLPQAVKSIFDVYNTDTISLHFSTTSTASLGNLNINYNFEQANQHGVLQVYREQKLIKEVKVLNQQGLVSLEGIQPGDYQLKYISDWNNNGVWSAGNYWTKQQPENVYWYSEPINLRANWDLDVNWQLIP